MKFQVLNRGTLEVPGKSFSEGLELGHKRSVKHATKLRDLSNNCTALDTILSHRLRPLGPLGTVTDYFAGIGLWATIVQHYAPASLTLMELDLACSRHLAVAFPRAKVVRRNSYQSLGEEVSELSLLDITCATSRTVLASTWAHQLFDGRTAIILSDCAGLKLHMNYKSYGLKSADYNEYLAEYSRRLDDRFGYRCGLAVACGGRERPVSGYLLLGKEYSEEFELIHVSNPTGITAQ